MDVLLLTGLWPAPAAFSGRGVFGSSCLFGPWVLSSGRFFVLFPCLVSRTFAVRRCGRVRPGPAKRPGSAIRQLKIASKVPCRGWWGRFSIRGVPAMPSPVLPEYDNNEEEGTMWTKPAYQDLRIGFEVTMYFANR